MQRNPNAERLRRIAARCGFAALSALLAAGIGPSAARAAAFEEHALKAALLLKLTSFVTWPPDSLPAQVFTVGVAGAGSASLAMEEALKGRKVNGLPVVVRKIRRAGDADSCKIVFIPDIEPALMQRTLELLSGRPILTVGDSPSFLLRGGIIRFRIIRQRMRFDIARRAAEQAGLHLSSNLLRVAERVVD